MRLVRFSSRKEAGANGGNIATIDADAAGDQIGYSVAGLGDLDDNGLDDVAVGAPLNDSAASQAGRVYFVMTAAADEMTPPAGGDAPSGEPADDEASGRPDLDLDGDGAVTLADLYLFLDAWSDDRPEADLDQDGVVDELDVLLLMGAWN